MSRTVQYKRPQNGDPDVIAAVELLTVEVETSDSNISANVNCGLECDMVP